MITQGTTPKHFFNLPFDTELIDKIKVIYSQNDNVLLVKEQKECTCEGKVVNVCLTQEETFLFDCKLPVRIQIRVLTSGGDALVSKIKSVGVEKCLESEVME